MNSKNINDIYNQNRTGILIFKMSCDITVKYEDTINNLESRFMLLIMKISENVLCLMEQHYDFRGAHDTKLI